MTKIIGIDIGNSFTKTSEGIKFPSKVSKNYGKSYLNDAYSVVLNEKDKFLVGDPLGVSFTSSNKYLQQEYIVTLLTAVALSGKKWKKDRLDVNIVLGCPVEVYDYQKKSAKESAINLGPQSITIGDYSCVVNIEDVIVAPQSAIVGTKPVEHFPILVLDFGGGTLDVSLWCINDNNIPCKTYDKTLDKYGFDNVVDEFIRKLYLNGISSTYEECLKYLNNPIMNTVFGRIDYSEIKDEILKDYVKNIFKDLMKYNLPKFINTVYIIGGCSEVIKDYVVSEMQLQQDKVLVDENPQFSNANSYYQIGTVVWK